MMRESATRPSYISALFMAFVGLGALGVGCGTTLQDDAIVLEAKQAPKLNLSHIECLDDGTVHVHFVLLFYGAGTPGTLNGTWSGGTFSGEAIKSTGNVWHYDIYLPAGPIEILGATVNGVSLRNPGEYSGDYLCDGATDECPIVVEAQDVYCTSQPLGNPGAECAHFGLLPIGKDDDLSGTSFVATTDAYVAIVKSGTAGCAPGESAYRIYVGVHEGDELLTPVNQGISHVTYCECPAATE
jgi:hypothetical protein